MSSEYGEVRSSTKRTLFPLLAEKGQETQATTAGRKLENLLLNLIFFKYTPLSRLHLLQVGERKPHPLHSGVPRIKPEMVRRKYKNPIYRGGRRYLPLP